MSHITIDWIDWAWKTITSKLLWAIMFVKYKRLWKQQLLKNLEDPNKSMWNIFWLIDQNWNNYIMDRSIISLVVYYLNNWNLIDPSEQKNIIKDFLSRLEWSSVIMMMCDYETCKNRLKFREDVTWKLSANDQRIMNEPEYFQAYYESFDNIFNIIQQVIRENNLKIRAIKINSPKIPFWSISKELFIKLPKWWQRFVYSKLFE